MEFNQNDKAGMLQCTGKKENELVAYLHGLLRTTKDDSLLPAFFRARRQIFSAA